MKDLGIDLRNKGKINIKMLLRSKRKLEKVEMHTTCMLMEGSR